MRVPSAIGPYRVVRELGRGGMGIVLLVEEPESRRQLALKLIRPERDSQVALERFWREAEALARIRHRNVVRIHQVGQAPEGSYLVMGHVEGEPLDAGIARGRPPPNEAARIVRALADALVAVHEAGLLHRDIKPGNVILQPDGIPVLLDFGLVRDASAERLTRTGTTLGSLLYMSPEQAGAESTRTLGPQTDIYSLGLVFFELLTGELPFEVDSPAVVVAQKLHEPPRRARSLCKDVPPALDAICHVCLSRRPADRYATAAELREDLDRFLGGQDPLALRRSRRRPWPILLAITLLAVGLALWPRSAEPPPVGLSPPPSAPPVPGAAATPNSAGPKPQPALPPRLHPDPPRVFKGLGAEALLLGPTTALIDEGKRLSLRNLAEERELWFRESTGAMTLARSPAGASACVGEKLGILWIGIRPEDGSPQGSCQVGEGVNRLAISPDETLAAVSGPGAPVLLLLQIDLRDRARLGNPRRYISEHTERVRFIGLTDEHLVVGRGESARPGTVKLDNSVRVYDLASGEVLQTWELPHEINCGAVSPWDHRVAVGDESGHIYVFDIERGPVGELLPEESERAQSYDRVLAAAHNWSVRELAFFPGGRWLASTSVSDVGQSLCLWDTERRVELDRRPTRSRPHSLSVAPDGSHLLLGIGSRLELYALER